MKKYYNDLDYILFCIITTGTIQNTEQYKISFKSNKNRFVLSKLLKIITE